MTTVSRQSHPFMAVIGGLSSGTAEQVSISIMELRDRLGSSDTRQANTSPTEPQTAALRGFLALPYELRAPIYRYLLDGQNAIQTPGTPPTHAFTALKRRVPCLTPQTPGKCRFGCPVHDNGLQVLRLCKFIHDNVMEILRGSRCDVLINEHGIFRSYRIPPQIKHEYKSTKMELEQGGRSLPGADVERRECEESCPCHEQEGMRVSIQLSPFYSLNKKCWEMPNWAPRCKREKACHFWYNSSHYWGMYCQCRAQEVSYEQLGLFMFNKAFWAVRENVCNFVAHSYRGMAEYSKHGLLIRLEFVGFDWNLRVVGNIEKMVSSVLEPFSQRTQAEQRGIQVERRPREVHMPQEYHPVNQWLKPNSRSHSPNQAAPCQPQQQPTIPVAPNALDATRGLALQKQVDNDVLYHRWAAHHLSVFAVEKESTLPWVAQTMMHVNEHAWRLADAVIQAPQVVVMEEHDMPQAMDGREETRDQYHVALSNAQQIVSVRDQALRDDKGLSRTDHLQKAIEYNELLLKQLQVIDQCVKDTCSENEWLRDLLTESRNGMLSH